MKKKSRAAGIDLFRGLAIYAVVILHSDEGISVLPPVWKEILQFAGFAVPFFLATSFYLAINKLYISGGQYPLKTRLIRLLIPYGFWSCIYLLYKGTKYLMDRDLDKLNKLFHDPLSIFFFGGAAFHLYFLPLLISGTLLIKFSEYLIKKQLHLKTLLFLCILTFTVYELLLVSGNSFQLGSDIAFQPLLDSTFPHGNKNPLVRLVLGELAWMLRCLPYIFVAMILSHPRVRERFLKPNPNYISIFLLIFFVFNLWGGAFLPEALYEVARGYLAFLLAISISTALKENPMITNLGLCSFGIYLMHLIVVEAFQIIGNRVAPETLNQPSTPILLAISILSFMISWMATSFFIKNKSISKLMFGS